MKKLRNKADPAAEKLSALLQDVLADMGKSKVALAKLLQELRSLREQIKKQTAQLAQLLLPQAPPAAGPNDPIERLAGFIRRTSIRSLEARIKADTATLDQLERGSHLLIGSVKLLEQTIGDIRQQNVIALTTVYVRQIESDVQGLRAAAAQTASVRGDKGELIERAKGLQLKLSTLLRSLSKP